MQELPYIQGLGVHIERAWLKHNYDEAVFPDLVLDTLVRFPPIGQVEVRNIVEWIFGDLQRFRQADSRELFGEPPITLYEAPRFYIEALFWFSSTPDIHEHAFSGAFMVLSGSSVHSHWQFTRERMVNSRMLCGRLDRISTEILRPGGMRPIHSGDRLIHQLFHLDSPSVTIVVRTYVDRHHLPQYRYLLPGLAMDSDDRDGRRTRRLVLLNAMARGQIEGLRECSTKLIESCDLETTYRVFSALSHRKVDGALMEELHQVARRRHGDIVDLFRRVCEEERRTRVVKALRSKVSDPRARFLLALLMLMPDRDSLLETIKLDFPDSEPLAAIDACIEPMSGKDTIGFDFNATNRAIFRGLVEGLDAEDLLQRLQAEFESDPVDQHRDRLLQHARKMVGSPLFSPLFSQSPLRESPLRQEGKPHDAGGPGSEKHRGGVEQIGSGTGLA